MLPAKQAPILWIWCCLFSDVLIISTTGFQGDYNLSNYYTCFITDTHYSCCMSIVGPWILPYRTRQVYNVCVIPQHLHWHNSKNVELYMVYLYFIAVVPFVSFIIPMSSSCVACRQFVCNVCKTNTQSRVWIRDIIYNQTTYILI